VLRGSVLNVAHIGSATRQDLSGLEGYCRQLLLFGAELIDNDV
jgi:hypothetical protein